MHERNVEENNPDSSQEKPQQKSENFTFANLQKKFMAGGTDNAAPSLQRKATLKELEGLRKSGKREADKQPQASAERAQSVKVQPGNVARLRSKLIEQGIFPQDAANVQHEEVSADLSALQKLQGNVRNKAKELDDFFRKSRRALDQLKENAVSVRARATLVTEELKVFEEAQRQHLEVIRGKLEQDIRAYAESETLQQFTYARYLELSFSYRAYQVCLEQDFLRHAAEATGAARMAAAPSELAVQSLNYYQDFFRNLPDIEQIWPGAGLDIRTLEIKDVIPKVHSDPALYSVLIGDPVNPECCERLDQLLKEYIEAHADVRKYVSSGDGLDMRHHPWDKLGLQRLEQPNTSLDFNDIAAQDETYVEAVTQVADRVHADGKLHSPTFFHKSTPEEDAAVRLKFKTVVDCLMGLGMTSFGSDD